MNTEVSSRRDFADARALAAHLVACGGDFLEKLQARVDLDDYAGKLCARALRFEAYASGVLIGLVAVYANDDLRQNAFISNVSVLPEWRGRGIASGLLRDCIDCLRRAGFARVELEVDEVNNGARRFYANLGFAAADIAPAGRHLQLDLIQGDSFEHRA
jgi:ribosomal protein S18 acetylase RimI-like enzyme